MTADTIVMTADPPIPARRRIMIRLAMFGANEHPRIKALKKALDMHMTGARPYISDSGARKSGPTAYPKTYIEIIRVPTVLELRPNSSNVREVPGAHNEDAMGENVDMQITQNMRNHFWPFVQCLYRISEYSW